MFLLDGDENDVVVDNDVWEDDDNEEGGILLLLFLLLLWLSFSLWQFVSATDI